MGTRGTNARRASGAGRRPAGRSARRRRRLPASAALALLFAAGLGAALFLLLPTARGGLSLPRGQIAARQGAAHQGAAHQGADRQAQPPQFEPPAGFAPPEQAPQAPAQPPAALTPTERPEAPAHAQAPAEPAPPEQAPPQAQPPAAALAAPERPPAREQGIFFVHVENDGASLRLERVSRDLGASNTPLRDSLNALLSGPTAEEARRGMVSFIPPETRLLSVHVEGGAAGAAGADTAFISFNEYFKYNIGGSEGLALQIQQIVWTATEFPNVGGAQILIEGNRVDFLHGGIRIGSPIGR